MLRPRQPRTARTWLAVAAVSLALTGAAAAPAVAQAHAPARGTLNSSQPEMRLDGVPLSDALAYLQDVTGVNMSVNWRALEAIGVARDTPVTVRLRNVKVRKALQVILNEAAPGQLAYYVDQNVLQVTTKELADADMVTRVYDIRDLLVEVPDFKAPDFDIGNGNSGGSGGSNGGRGGGFGGGSGGGNLFGGNGSGNGNNQNDENRTTRAERGQQIVDLIVETIRPDVWQVNGGKAGIRYFNGTIIVTAPRSVHEAIDGPVN
jgi:uncharacterized membrane protein YgcG